MTAAALTPSKEYIENGVTLAYAVPFRFRAPTHIKAQRISVAGVVTELVYGTDYSVTGGETDSGGTLTVAISGVAGTRLRIRRETPRAQDMDYTTADTFPAESHEVALDKAMLIDQEQDQKIDDTASRALLVPDGEIAPTISPKAERAGKFPLWDITGENLLNSNGTGTDLGLREDLLDLGEAIIASPEPGQDMANFRKRWKRYLDSSATAIFTALLPVPANAGLVGNATNVQAQAGHTGPTMFTLASGSQLGDIDVDGTNLPAPTANWFSGSPKGAAVFAAGVDVSNRISGFKIDGKFRNLKNGGINLEFAENFDLGTLNFEAIQSDVTYTLCAALEMYQAREFSGGTIRINGYRKKGVSLNYCTKGTLEKIVGIGGLPADALVHLVGGYLLDIGPVIHDGDGTLGYTIKAWNSRQLNFGMVQTLAVQEAVQCYGSHVTIAGLDALDHAASAAQVDAYQARTSPETNAECEFVCNGEFRAVRSVSGSTAQNALTVRTDPLTGCPINRIKIQSMYVRGHFSAIYCQVGAGAWDKFECGNIDVDAISNSGYLYFGKAKSFSASFTVGNLVRNGMVAFTDADTRGGTFHLKGLQCLEASSAWTTEPLVRLGYPGATSFSEAGFERIVIENIFVDGANSANLKLIDLRLHTGDYTREITIRNVVGRNLVAAEQIRIELNAAATDVKLILEDIDITDSSGAQLGITVVNGNRVTSGQIGDGVLPAITGRPAKCQPLYVQHSVDLSGLASGATSGDQLVTVTGTVAGDQVTVVPRNATLSPLELRVTAANQIGFKVKNLGAGAGPNPALFDCFVRRSRIA